MRKALIPLILLLAGGCTSYATVEPLRTTIDDAFIVEPQVTWTRIQRLGPSDPNQIWTIDGVRLNALLFYPGIADNEPLVRQKDSQEKAPVFRKDLSSEEIMELFEATLTRSTQSTLTETHNLRPVRFGGVPGFRFEMTFTMKDEVPRKATIAGAVRDDRLYLIVYQAPRLYYFDKYAGIVEDIIASVQFVGGPVPPPRASILRQPDVGQILVEVVAR